MVRISFLKYLGSFALAILLPCMSSAQSRELVTSDITNAIASDTAVKIGPVHFPAYLSSFSEFRKYQMRLADHQNLEIRWDSMHGATEVISLEKARNLPVSGNFSLIQQQRNQPAPPRLFDPSLVNDRIITVGMTDAGEIRGLENRVDPRLSHSEDFHSHPPKRYDFVTPIETFQVELPNDASITQLLFFQTVVGRESGPTLKLLGKLSLKTDMARPTN
jgi:hypothetical protein